MTKWMNFSILLISLMALVLSPMPAGGKAMMFPIKFMDDLNPSASPAGYEPALRNRSLFFIPNRGQSDSRVSYYVQGSEQTIFFTSQGITFSLAAPSEPVELPDTDAPLKTLQVETPANRVRQRWAIRLDFVGSNPNVQPVGELPTQTVVSYFRGNPDQWQAGLPTFGQIRYHELWPGIDLLYSGGVNELKYEFIVQSGSDPSLIRLAYHGTSEVKLADDGSLEVSTPAGSFRDSGPIAYQVRDGQRLPVKMAFDLKPGENAGEAAAVHFGFDVGEYDPTLPLILDPVVLVYVGFIGGSGEEYGESIAVDSAGNAYITGETYMNDFPVTVGPDLTQNGSAEAFVVKVSADGTTMLYAGYIGGADADYGRDIAVDQDGAAYLTGYTFSSETSFPVLGGPDLTYKGSGDAFLVKVNPGGTSLGYAGYIGGNYEDYGYGIAVDGQGNAYIAGETGSDDRSFPVVVGPDLTFNGGQDAFVAKVNHTGSALSYSGYIGGVAGDAAYDIAVDAQGNAYLTGATLSDESSFPVIVGPDLTFNTEPEFGYYQDGFVSKVNASGTGLVYAGYLGGWERDAGLGIAVDTAGHAYVTGWTRSSDFPSVAGPYLTHNGLNDAYILEVNTSGAGLVFSGFFGGTGDDSAQGIALGPNGVIYITGVTDSAESSFPILDGPDITYNGGDSDVFITAIKPPEGSVWLVYSGYIGGSEVEVGYGIAVDPAGNAYVTGFTYSTETSFPAIGGPDLTPNGGADVFVVKVGYWVGESFDLSVSRVELIQGITMSSGYRVHVANKPAMLRVFVNLEGRSFVNGVVARLTRFVSGVEQDSIELGPVTIYSDTDENVLQDTLNFDLPALWLQTGTSYALQLDPGQLLADGNISNNRYPASGASSFNFVNTPVLDVVIVPVTYAPPGQPVTNPSLGDLSYLTWMPRQVYPVAQINYTVRSPAHTFSRDLSTSSGWTQLLNDITTIHNQEDPQQKKIYYGLVDAYGSSSCTGCTAGMAWFNEPAKPLKKTGVGISNYSSIEQASETFTHEVGHIFGRAHVENQCWITFPPYQEDFPYEKASIGQWGVNLKTREVFLPSSAHDYMSYCGNKWTSDFTYYELYRAFQWVEDWRPDLPYRTYLPSLANNSQSLSTNQVSGRSLTISGTLAADGSLQVSPLFLKPGPPDRVDDSGEYSLALLDASGRQLSVQPIAFTQIAIDRITDGEMTAGFHINVPFVEGVAGVRIMKDGQTVFERFSTSGAPRLGDLTPTGWAGNALRLSWAADDESSELTYRVLFSPDGGMNWQMLATNTKQPDLSVPVDLVASAAQPRLLVQVSDGIQIDERIYELDDPYSSSR